MQRGLKVLLFPAPAFATKNLTTKLYAAVLSLPPKAVIKLSSNKIESWIWGCNLC